MSIANIDSLIGRSFISKSNNTCKIQKIGEGAIRAFWKTKPTLQDKNEFNNWAESILGNINLTESIGKKNETKNYLKWKEQNAKT